MNPFYNYRKKAYSSSKTTLTNVLSISQRPVPSSPITSNNSKMRRATYSSSTCSAKNHCKKLKVTKSLTCIHLSAMLLNCSVTNISCCNVSSNTPRKDSKSTGTFETSGEIGRPPRLLM